MRKAMSILLFVLSIVIAFGCLRLDFFGLGEQSGLARFFAIIIGLPVSVMLLALGAILLRNPQSNATRKLKIINIIVAFILIFIVPLYLRFGLSDTGFVLQVIISVPCIVVGIIALFTLDEPVKK
ncbi:hypothetical protein JNM87_06005 [Candidatus Saccharibacteria bacterium]|nr:hypothetical protein [Candidatus Saccharibacteria bacterium]